MITTYNFRFSDPRYVDTEKTLRVTVFDHSPLFFIEEQRGFWFVKWWRVTYHGPYETKEAACQAVKDLLLNRYIKAIAKRIIRGHP